MSIIKLGLIGCGAIGSGIAKKIKSVNSTKITLVYDLDVGKAERFSKKYKTKVAKNIFELISKTDIIIEAASQKSVKENADVILSKRDLVILSIGALTDQSFLKKLEKTMQRNNTQLYVPSGAVCGVDSAKAAAFGKIEKALLTTTKSPASLGLKNKRKTVVFDGYASQAARKYPKNINVAAVLQLAIKKRLRVRIISDPTSKRNKHELYLRGEFGELRTGIRNFPSRDNPKTSQMAIYSALSVLDRIQNRVKLGN